mmetsp:Transcript_19697/g.45857  ORF Transcript_19697/g.45857 Transcript_19697/m.45857 type:complete len:98 (-) Transcript_19697:42-335(-)
MRGIDAKLVKLSHFEFEGLSGEDPTRTSPSACPTFWWLKKCAFDDVIKVVSGLLIDGNATPPRRAAKLKMTSTATRSTRLPCRRKRFFECDNPAEST